MVTAHVAETVTELRSEGSCADEALMQSYQRGDDGAFRELYLRYRARLYRFVRRMIKDGTLAEEIIQETWLAVINGKARYVPEARFVTYLFGIARKRIADHLRRQRSRARGVAESGEAPLADISSAHSETPSRWLESEALGQAVLHAVEQLPVEQREAFLLKAEGDLSLLEISRMTGVGRETVKSRLRYAVSRLRHELRNWR